MSDSLQHAAIILAAGASRRLGTAKQLVTMDGESLINRTIRMARDTHPAQTIAVLGHRADEIFTSITHKNIERVDCGDWQLGMGASLRAGIRNVNAECSGALILLCDQPALSESHLRSMIDVWLQYPDHAVASGYSDTVGVPALLPRSWFAKISALEGDHGARDWLRSDRNVIRIEAPELAQDVDTAQDLPTDFA